MKLTQAIFALAVFLLVSATASAQTINHAWFAKGQAWVVWEATPPVPETYRIYKSAVPFGPSIAGAEQVGRLYKADWEGARLKLGSPSWTLRIPNPLGGQETLTASEGVFAYTPHAAETVYFAVVKDGETAVTATNSTGPITCLVEPVTAHLQRTGTLGGQSFRVYAHWVDGRDNYEENRPDYPVMGNAGFNGTPRIFSVWDPVTGPPSGKVPLVIGCHGGNGTWSNFTPPADSSNAFGRVLSDGLFATLDGNEIFKQTVASGPIVDTIITGWIGYWHGLDRFRTVDTQPVPNDAVIVNYVMRRVSWTVEWIRDNEPVDASRISIMGHSMGSEGAFINARYRPDLFAAAQSFAILFRLPDSSSLLGTPEQNLRTNLPGSPGTDDLANATLNIARNGENDRPFTRIVVGRSDSNNLAQWNENKVSNYQALSDGAHGTAIFWDGRDHDPASFEGQFFDAWERAKARGLTRYRNDQSYPAFFDDDQDPAEPGRQPSLGNGDPREGDPAGTWAGYFDWDQSTLEDTSRTWAGTLFLTGLSAVTEENFPGSSARCSVAVRRPQQFRPAPGTAVNWELARLSDGVVLQRGAEMVGADGLVIVRGLTILRDPERTRLTVKGPDPAERKPVLSFQRDYEPGTRDASGQFMGGTETMRLVAHKGKLYAAMSYWTDVPGGDPSPGGQILVKEGPQSPWKVSGSFPGTVRIYAMERVTFTRDHTGARLARPVTLLVADAALGSGEQTEPLRCVVLDDATGRWVVSPITASAPQALIRAFGSHHDATTGVDLVFAGTGAGEVYSGAYDPAAPGGLRWNPIPEHVNPDYNGTPFYRCSAFCAANGRAYASISPRLLERLDGPSPSWREVFRWFPEERAGAGLRGITAVPALTGPHQVILGSLEQEGRIIRIHPANGFASELELQSDRFISARFARKAIGGKLVAYNRFEPATHPLTREPVHYVPVQAVDPDDPGAAWLMIRRHDATYELVRVFDDSLAPHPVLVSTRTFEVSPWSDHEIYTGGFDGAANDRVNHNSAWIFKGSISPQRKPAPGETPVDGTPVRRGDGAAPPWPPLRLSGPELALAVLVTSAERARSFYVEGLGMADRGEAANPPPGMRMYLYGSGQATLKVRVPSTPPPARDPALLAEDGLRFLTIPVAGFDAALERLAARGFAAPVVRSEGGVRTALAADGDGNVVEIVDAATAPGRKLEIGLVVPGATDARRFYSTWLGFPEAPPVAGPSPVPAGELRFRANGTVLRVFAPPGARPAPPDTVSGARGFRYITFTLEGGVRALHDRMAAAGVPVVLPLTAYGASAQIFMVRGPGGAVHEFVGPRETTGSGLGAMSFRADYLAPAEPPGAPLSETLEALALEPHKGRLFCSTSYVGPAGTPASANPKVLVKDTAASPWRVDFQAGNVDARIAALRSVSFTTDGEGNVLTNALGQPQPVPVLIAGTGQWRSWYVENDPNRYGVYVLTRDDDNDTWVRHKLDDTPWNPRRLNHTQEVRVLFDHVDRVTGVHYVFASSRNGRVFRGWYDGDAPGKVAWAAQPELGGLVSQGLCAAEANGIQYLGIAFGSNGDDPPVLPRPVLNNGLWRRIDGVRDPVDVTQPLPANPQWEWVNVPEWENPSVPGASLFIGQLRGLSAIPDPKGGAHQVLAMHWDSPDNKIHIVDPLDGYKATQELDTRQFVRDLWGSSAGMITAGYNDWLPALDPASGEEVHLIGAWAIYPGGETATELGKSSWFLVRDARAQYTLVRIWDPRQPLAGAPYGLRGCRSIRPSPFPEEAGRVFYFAGFDLTGMAGGGQVTGSRGWVYRGELGEPGSLAIEGERP